VAELISPDDLTKPLDARAITGPAASGMVASAGASGAPPIGLTQAKGRPTIPVSSVLTNLVEGYLLGDLESMATEVQRKEMGACGYPMVMAVLSGSELLGAMTTDAAQDDRIEAYWKTYMAKIDPLYGYLGKIASQLARDVVRGHRLLVATGRRPRVSGFGLEKVGAEANAHGIRVDEHLRAGERLWAIGDVTGILPLTHVGEYQGEVVASNGFLALASDRERLTRAYALGPEAGDASDPCPRPARGSHPHDPTVPELLGDLRRGAQGAPPRDRRRAPACRGGIVMTHTAALPALTANLVLELAPIRVNLIAAGFVDTPRRRRCSATTSKSTVISSGRRSRSGASSGRRTSLRSPCT
jgi:hypothetical protein